jgi:hypothetical protein
MTMAGPSLDSLTAPVGLCSRDRELHPQPAVPSKAASATTARRADVSPGPIGTLTPLLLDRQLDALLAFGRPRFHPTSRCGPSQFGSTRGDDQIEPQQDSR